METSQYFIHEESIVFCHNIEGLLLYIGAVSYDPDDCRFFFLESSKWSLK